MLSKKAFVQPPTPELEKVFYDFGKNKRTEQVELMTRYFAITGTTENKVWKMINKKAKVLDYTCMGAEMKKGDNKITVWYTPEIPVSDASAASIEPM